MDTMRICSACKQPLAPNAPEGLCPECLLKAGLGSGLNAGPDSETDSRRRRFAVPAPEALAPLFPQLEIVDLLGQGGMGAVYRARQKNLDRIVALKVLPPDIGNEPAFAERFAREARALARLNHPGIVTLYEFGQVAVPNNGGMLEAENAQPSTVNPQPPLYFFLMEFADGVNLRQLIEAGRLSPREALAIVPQICDALQYAHDQGIVHRDIKPENILLDRQGRVKVADFGLAKLVGTGAESVVVSGTSAASPALTDAGKVMGTPLYMAPEQLDRPLEVDHRADIYSLGVVFYQMLTGELPAERIEPPSRKVRLDVRLDEVVLRALEKEPERRYQQASVLKTQVETIAAGRPTPASSMSARGPQSGAARTAPAKSSPPHRILWLRVQMIAASTALMILLLLCGILGYLTFILPRQVALWAEDGAALPTSDRLLVELGQFCQHFGLLLIPLLLLVTGGAAVWLIVTLAKSRSRRAARSSAPAGRSGEIDEEQPGRDACHRVPNSDRGCRNGVESVPPAPGNAQTAGVGIEDPAARPADEQSIISPILLAGAFLLPPVLFVWFLLASHRAQSRNDYEIRRWEKAELELTRLLPQMRSPDVAQRRQAASTVFTMGSYARSAVPDLIQGMKDDDGLVRMLAAGALGHLGEGAGPVAAAALLEGLTDADQRARFYAAVALAQVDRSTTANLAVLVDTLTNRPPDDPHGIWQIQRREAAEALGVMAGRARPALPVLRALEEDEPSLRNSVQEAIRRIEKSRGVPDQAAIPALPSATKSPRETVAEWLRLIKDSQRSREAWELTTREGAGWGPSFTKLEEYDQIRPLHQFGNEQQAMVVSNPFFEARQPRVFYAMLLKREGKWLIADHDRGDPKTVSAFMHGFFMNRGMEFDVLAEELVGHWEGPCLEFTLAADGTGTWLVTGPEGPLPQPQPFQWTVSGAALKFHDAEGERKAKVTWVENDTFHFAYPGGDGRAVWRQKDQEAK